MANRKKASPKSKTLLEKEKYTAELSSRQLVIGVCILIAFGLACFMLGVIVGRFEPLEPQLTAENERTRTFVTTSNINPGKDLETNTEPVVKKPVGNKTGPPSNRRESVRVGPDAVSAARQPRPPSRIEKPLVSKSAAESTPKTPPTPVAETPTATPKKSELPSKDPRKIARAERTPTEPKESTSSPPSARDVTADVWTVQIGVFGIRKNAAQIKARIDAKTSYTAELVDSADRKSVTVIVGKYASLAEAVKARDQLSKKYGYTDSFPRKHVPK